MKWSAERDDLSLLPHLTAQDKGALRRAGVTTTRDLAALKELRRGHVRRWRGAGATALVPAAGKEALVRRLAATWPVGPRLDELVHRARRYRHVEEGRQSTRSQLHPRARATARCPTATRTTTPTWCASTSTPSTTTCTTGSTCSARWSSACEGGVERPERRRSVVHLADGPPDSPQREERALRRLDRRHCCARSSRWRAPTRRGSRGRRST